ncbi:MAG: hypothetical protein ACK50J_17470, partial [Planctomyces sp.]
MNQIFPPSLLFQFQTPIRRHDSIPKTRGGLLSLSPEHSIFAPARVNSVSHGNSGVQKQKSSGSAPAFEIRMAWNPSGIGVSVEVVGKKHGPEGSRSDLRNSDFVRLMIDTRHTASVHRMTSYCQTFLILPVDTAAKNVPTVIHGESNLTGLNVRGNLTEIQLRYHSRPDGYLIETWMPATVLHGFVEAAEIRRIGFYCLVHDTELGELPLNVGDDFPVTIDPSQWLS